MAELAFLLLVLLLLVGTIRRHYTATNRRRKRFLRLFVAVLKPTKRNKTKRETSGIRVP